MESDMYVYVLIIGLTLLVYVGVRITFKPMVDKFLAENPLWYKSSEPESDEDSSE